MLDRTMRLGGVLRLVLLTAVVGLLVALLPASPSPGSAAPRLAAGALGGPVASEPVVPWQPVNIPSLIVQDPISFPAWRHIEGQAIAAVRELHQLRGDDQRVLAFARDEVRAAMFARLIAIAKQPAVDRTPEDQKAVERLSTLVQDDFVRVARSARNIYDTWWNNPCAWTINAPDPIDQDATFIKALATWCASPTAGQFTAPPAPPIEAFQAVAAWRYYKPIFDGPEFKKLLPNSILGLGFIGAMGGAGFAAGAGAAIAAGGFATGIASGLGSAAANVAAIPTAAASFAAAATAAIVAAVIICIVGSVLQGIQVVNDAEIPKKLDEAVTEAQDNLPDIVGGMADQTRSLAIYGVFLAQTLPDYAPADAYIAVPQVPYDPAVDPTLRVTPEPDGTPINAGVVGLDTWRPGDDGKPSQVRQERVFVHDGWFVRQVPGQAALTTSLNLPYVDADGRYKVAFLRGNGFVVTAVDSNGVLQPPADPASAVVDSLSVRAHLDEFGAVKATLLIPRPVIDRVTVPDGLVEGVEFTPTAVARDLGGSDVRYSWTVTLPCRAFAVCDGSRTPPSYDAFFVGPSPVMNIHAAGVHRAVLTVLNDAGATARLETTITVAKAVPTLDDMGHVVQADGRTVRLSGDVIHTGPGQQVTVRVQWGDGEQSSLTFPRTTAGVIDLDFVPIGRQPFELSHTYPVGPTRYEAVVTAQASNGTSSSGVVPIVTSARSIAVQAPSAAVVVGEPLGPLVPSVSGLPAGDDPAAVTPGACTTTRALDSPPGTYPVTCSGASGPPTYVFDSLPGLVTVSRAATRARVTLTPGSATALVAPVAPGAGTPTGDVAFTVDGVPAGTASLGAGGTATLPLPLAAGPVTVAASYGGDQSFSGSAASTAKADPTLVAQRSVEPNAAGWFRSPVSLAFACTEGSAPLAEPCPEAVQLGEGAGQSVSRSILASDGGVASVAVSGIDVDLTPPSVRVTGVRDGARLLAPLTAPLGCQAADALSGLTGACTVTTWSTTPATAPHFRATWEYVATATDRAGNEATVRGSYTVAAVRLLGAQPGARDAPRVQAGTLVPVIVDLPLRRAPRVLGVIPARRDFDDERRGARMVRRADGTWIGSVRLTRAQAQRARSWKLGIELPGRRGTVIVPLDVRR